MVPLRVLSRTTLTDRSRQSRLKPRRLILLQTLCPRANAQLLCNQANPNSFGKTPGVGYLSASAPRFAAGDCTTSGVNYFFAPFRFSALCLCASLAIQFAGLSAWRDPYLPGASKGAHFAKGRTNTKTAALTIFRINTCKSVSKQTSSTLFIINTYEKPGGGGRSRQSIRKPESSDQESVVDRNLVSSRNPTIFLPSIAA